MEEVVLQGHLVQADMMRGLGRQPILGGDFNCIIDKKDTVGGDYYKKKSPDLADLVRDFNLSDCFRLLYPDKREFTWERRGKAPSRLDRFYLPQDMVAGLQQVSHHSFLSDHKYVKMELKLPEVVKKAKKKKDRDSGYWKLNSSVLDYEDFLPEFQVMWERVKQRQEDYEDIADW